MWLDVGLLTIQGWLHISHRQHEQCAHNITLAAFSGTGVNFKLALMAYNVHCAAWHGAGILESACSGISRTNGLTDYWASRLSR